MRVVRRSRVQPSSRLTLVRDNLAHSGTFGDIYPDEDGVPHPGPYEDFFFLAAARGEARRPWRTHELLPIPNNVVRALIALRDDETVTWVLGLRRRHRPRQRNQRNLQRPREALEIDRRRRTVVSIDPQRDRARSGTTKAAVHAEPIVGWYRRSIPWPPVFGCILEPVPVRRRIPHATVPGAHRLHVTPEAAAPTSLLWRGLGLSNAVSSAHVVDCKTPFAWSSADLASRKVFGGPAGRPSSNV